MSFKTKVNLIQSAYFLNEMHQYQDPSLYKELLIFSIPKTYHNIEDLDMDSKKAIRSIWDANKSLQSCFILDPHSTDLFYSFQQPSYVPVVKYKQIISSKFLRQEVFNLKQEVVLDCLGLYPPCAVYVLYATESNIVHSWLVWVCHHLLFDGYSYSMILQKQINQAYNNQQIDYSTKSYLDYNMYYEDYSKKNEEDLKWMISYIKPFHSYLTTLPIDRIRPVKRSSSGSVTYLKLDSRAQDIILKCCKLYNCSIYTYMIYTFVLFLIRLTLDLDINVGGFSNTRSNSGFQKVVGNLVNVLVYSFQIKDTDMLNTSFCHVNNTIRLLERYSGILYYDIVSKIPHNQRQRTSSFFQVMSNYTFDYYTSYFLPDETQFNSVHSEPLEYTSCLYDLMYSMYRNKKTTWIELRSSNDIFDVSTIQTLIRRWEKIILQSYDPLHIMDLSINLEEDYQFQNTYSPSYKTLHELDISCIQEQIVQEGKQNYDKIAIILDDSHMTYKELLLRSYELSIFLSNTYHIQKGDVVISFLDRSIEMIVGIVSILMMGCVYCPVNPLDSIERLQVISKSTNSKLVLSHVLLEGLLVETKILLDITHTLDEVRHQSSDPDDIAYIAHTSGSTGIPKGACICQSSCINWYYALSQYSSFWKTCRVLQFSRSSFDPHIRDIIITLMRGKTIVMLNPRDSLQFDYVLNTINDKKVDMVCFTPSYFMELSKTCPQELHKLESLRVCSFIGEPLYYYHLAPLYEVVSDCEIYNFYGPVEVTCEATVHIFPLKDLGLYSLEKSVPLGTPLYNVECHLVKKGTNGSRYCCIGETGDLMVSGKGLMKGYWNQPDKTNRVLYYSPMINKVIYETGDLVKVNKDMTLSYIGRTDFQVKIRGQRIELGEIDSMIRVCKKVIDSYTTVYKDNDTEECLVSYVLSSEKGKDLETDIQCHLKKCLPVWMQPSFIISLNKWPLNLNGKIDRKALPKPIRTSINSEDLMSSIDERLKSLFSSYPIQNEFSRLGLSSFQLMKLVYSIKELFGVSCSIQEFSEFKNIIELQEWIMSNKYTIQETIKQTDIQSYKALLGQQLIYLHQMFNISFHSPVYTITFKYKLERKISSDKIKSWFKNMIIRYDIFRTSFKWNKGLVQTIIPFHEEMMNHYIYNDTHNLSLYRDHKFNVDRPPLIRVLHFDSSIVLQIHHIVYDHGCDHILRREWERVNESIPLRFIDYCIHIQPSLKSSSEFWKNYIDISLAYTSILTKKSYKKREGKSYKVFWSLNSEDNIRIQNLCSTYNTSIYTILLSLLSFFLHQRDLLLEHFYISSVHHNRSNPDFYNLWGYLMTNICYKSNRQYTSSMSSSIDYWIQETNQVHSHSDTSFLQHIDLSLLKKPDSFCTIVFTEVAIDDQNSIHLLQETNMTQEWIYPEIKYSSVFPFGLYFINRSSVLSGWFEIDEQVYDSSEVESLCKEWTVFISNILKT